MNSWNTTKRTICNLNGLFLYVQYTHNVCESVRLSITNIFFFFHSCCCGCFCWLVYGWNVDCWAREKKNSHFDRVCRFIAALCLGLVFLVVVVVVHLLHHLWPFAHSVKPPNINKYRFDYIHARTIVIIIIIISYVRSRQSRKRMQKKERKGEWRKKKLLK